MDILDQLREAAASGAERVPVPPDLLVALSDTLREARANCERRRAEFIAARQLGESYQAIAVEAPGAQELARQRAEMTQAERRARPPATHIVVTTDPDGRWSPAKTTKGGYFRSCGNIPRPLVPAGVACQRRRPEPFLAPTMQRYALESA